jgi:hypothetical protein
MSAESLTTLLPALDMALFERAADGSFTPLAPPPHWFRQVTSDTTFPFLGYILEEAGTFWQRGTAGTTEWGPCAEVNEKGVEYHYRVTALIADGRQYLVFQLDPGADRMREVLQKVRSQALSAEQDSATHEAVAAELWQANADVKELMKLLLLSNPTPAQLELLNRLATNCVALMGGVAKLIRATTIPRV